MNSGISTQEIFADDRREALDDNHLYGCSRTSHPGTTNSNEIIEMWCYRARFYINTVTRDGKLEARQ